MPDFSAEVGQPCKAFESCDTAEFAFESCGVYYYSHSHRGFNMTYSKWFELSTMTEYHEKWQLTENDVNEFFRVDRDALSQIRALVASNQPEEALVMIDELSTYQALVGVRRQLKHPEALYREASVFYFDHSEDPAAYDEIYAEQKIRRWMQDPELVNNKDLFFSPVARLLPSHALSMSTEALEQMILEIREMVRTGATTAVLASEIALMLGESSGIEGSTLRNMHLRQEILKEYESLMDLLSSRI